MIRERSELSEVLHEVVVKAEENIVDLTVAAGS